MGVAGTQVNGIAMAVEAIDITLVLNTAPPYAIMEAER
jgi:hypothetical protein